MIAASKQRRVIHRPYRTKGEEEEAGHPDRLKKENASLSQGTV
jgi:hypothetical protein